MLATLLCIVAMVVVLRATTATHGTAAPDGPTPTASSSPFTSSSTTTSPRPTTTLAAPDGGRGHELTITPADLPCPVTAGRAEVPDGLALAPEPDALIPGSTSVLSWIDPDLNVTVVPGADVVVLTSGGGGGERRRVGRIEPRTGEWRTLFDQEGCSLTAAIAAGGVSPTGMWVLLASGDATYLADVALDDGRIRWSGRADGATDLIDAGGAVWVIGDAQRPTEQRLWSGQTALVAVDASTHEVAPPIRLRAAIIPADPGVLVVVQNERVTRLDPATGAITDRLGTIKGLYAGDLFTDRATIAGGWLWSVDGYGAAAAITRRALDTFEAETTQDAPCGRLLPRWSSGHDDPTIADVTGCGTELTIHAVDAATGRVAVTTRFTTHVQYEFDRPVPVMPPLVRGASGFWYLGQLPKPTSPRGGPPSTDARWHLLHVETPSVGR